MMERVTEIARSMADRPGALLPVLHAVQGEFGYVAPGAVPHIARELNLSRAEVHGAISFYHLIRCEPPGNRVIYICRAESCQAAGSRALEAHAKSRLGIDYHQTSADGEFSLEPVYCLGNCSCSPSLMIDDRLYSRVDPARLDELLNT